MDVSKPKKKIAIITGASAGLGAEFALQVEKAFFLDEIWLVARRQDPMRDLAVRFQKSKGVLIQADLGKRGDLVALEKRLQSENPQIDILVNNAGHGKIGPVEGLGLDEQLNMIDVNVLALTYLTRAALPFMSQGGKIVQVASSAGFCPMPYFSVYAATKAYVVSFSEALGHELKNRGIQVLAVCPGPVATEFFDQAKKNEFLKGAGGSPVNASLTAGAREVVQQALEDLGKGRRRSVYSLPIRLFVWLAPLVPRWMLFRLLEKRKESFV